MYDEAAVKERYGMDAAAADRFQGAEGRHQRQRARRQRHRREDGHAAAFNSMVRSKTSTSIWPEVTPARAKSALEANREMAFLSKDLVTIRTKWPFKSRGKSVKFILTIARRSKRCSISWNSRRCAIACRAAAKSRAKRPPLAKAQQISMFGEERRRNKPVSQAPPSSAARVRDDTGDRGGRRRHAQGAGRRVEASRHHRVSIRRRRELIRCWLISSAFR